MLNTRTEISKLGAPKIKPEDAPLLNERVELSCPKALQQRVCDLETALEHRERQIDAMRRAGETLFTAPNLDELVRDTLEIAIEVLDADAGSLLLFDESDDTLVFRYVVGGAASTLIGFAMPSTRGIAGRVFQSGQPNLTQKVADQQDFNRAVDEKTGYRTESMMTVPVKRVESRPIGVMQVLNARELFDERDLEVLEVLSAVAAAAFDNARLAQAARKAAIVNVIGDISHDIKNMLTPIQSGVWTLEPMLDNLFVALDGIRQNCRQNEAWSTQVKAASEAVRFDYKWILAGALDAAEKVQARTKEIADALKGEIASPIFEEADLNATAQEVADSLAIVARDAQIDLQLRLDPNLPSACFDRRQIYNALYNLVNNAIPETPIGGAVTLRTRFLQQAELAQDGLLQAETIYLEVEDNGKGMTENVREKLFTDEAISTKPGGTGLGTRIVAGVVKRHNGKIEVHSEVGKGSKFCIQLPLRQPK